MASSHDAVVAAVAASSFDFSHTSFQANFGSLLDRAVTVLAPRPPRASSVADGDDTEPYWVSCVRKLKTAYERVGDATPFKAMFVNFFETNTDALVTPVFENDDKVNDAFFRDMDLRDPPCGKPKKAAGVNNGHVLYYCADPKIATVCLPISEIYNVALRKHRDAPSSNPKKKLLPTGVLLDFFACLYHSLPDDHPHLETLEHTIDDLCSAAEAVAPGAGPGAAATHQASSVFGGDLISNLMGMLGGGGGSAPSGEMGEAFRGISSVVKTLVEKVSEGAGEGDDPLKDPAAVVARLGNAFSSPEIQKQIAATATTASSLYAGLSSQLASVGGVKAAAIAEPQLSQPDVD
jgi:hypothetical protein